ncbi:MAG: MFS transporter [Conexibacteraceae bacterium]|nr:MFS transporter [Conexibacteraceae bacterium]
MSASARQRAAVLATFLAHGMLFASWTAHIPEVKARLGLSVTTLGTILLSTPVGAICAMLITSRLLPRLGSRRMVQVCVVGYCAGGPLVGIAGTPALLAVTLFAWGAFQGSLDVSMNTQATTVEHAQGRRLMPLFHGTWSIGAFTGAGVGAAAVALHIGLTPQLLVLAAPVLAATALLSASMIGDAQPAGVHSAHARARRFSRAAAALGAVAFAAMLCEGASADWSAVYLRGSAHVGPGLAGLGYASFAVMMAAVRLGGGRLLERVPQQRLLPLLTAIATAGMTIALVTGGAAPALVGFATLGAGVALVVPTLFTAAARLPGLETGVGIAVVSAMGWAGFVCGPPLIGVLAGLSSLRAALVVLPVLTLAITVATARIGAAGGAPPPGDTPAAAVTTIDA